MFFAPTGNALDAVLPSGEYNSYSDFFATTSTLQPRCSCSCHSVKMQFWMRAFSKVLCRLSLEHGQDWWPFFSTQSNIAASPLIRVRSHSQSSSVTTAPVVETSKPQRSWKKIRIRTCMNEYDRRSKRGCKSLQTRCSNYICIHQMAAARHPVLRCQDEQKH